MNIFNAIDKNAGENDQGHAEAYYEELAGQEEIYLEEREERARAVLISESPSPSGLDPDNGAQVNSSAPTKSNFLIAESGARQLDHVAEELITGDSDDPPLSEEAVAEMLRRTQKD